MYTDSDKPHQLFQYKPAGRLCTKMHANLVLYRNIVFNSGLNTLGLLALQKGPELASAVQEQTRKAHQEAAALQQDIAGLSNQVAPALRAFQAAHPSYVPPESHDQVTVLAC